MIEPERPQGDRIRKETEEQRRFLTDDVDHIIRMINNEPNEEDHFNDEHDPCLEWTDEPEFLIELTSEADKLQESNCSQIINLRNN